jgi:hypothetical protein
MTTTAQKKGDLDESPAFPLLLKMRHLQESAEMA